MTSPSPLDSPRFRFAPYIEELHEFFASHGVQFGSRGDMAPLVARLSALSSFHAELSSMIRSIVFRQGGSIPRAELLDLVTQAISGSHVDEADEDLQQPVGQLHAFLAEVLSVRRNMPPDRAQHDASSIVADDLHAMFPNAEETVSAGPDLQPGVPIDQDPVPSAVVREWQPDPSRTTTIEVGNAQAATDAAPPAYAPSRRPRSSSRLTPEAPLVTTAKRPAPWMLALCALLLAGSGGMILRHRSATPPASSVADTRAPSPRSIVPEPPPPANTPLVSSTQSASTETTFHPPIMPAPSEPRFRRNMRRDSGSLPQSGTSPVQKPAQTPVARQAAAPAIDRPHGPVPERGTTAARASSSPVSPTPGPPPAKAHSRTLSVSSGVMAANLITSPPPAYPKLASMTHVEGKVILQAVVSRDGTVVATHVMAGHRLLRGAAVNAVRAWRYRPFLVHGEPEDVATIVTVDFRLHP